MPKKVNMKKYASKKTHKGRIAYRTPSQFIYKQCKKRRKRKDL